MSAEIPYSALQEDLYYPCKHANFFSAGPPKSEAALCAEMARLAYCKQNSSFACNHDKIRSVLAGVGFTSCQFFENPKGPRGEGAHCFLAIREDKLENKRLAVVSFRGTDKDDPKDVRYDAEFRLEHWPIGGRVHTGFAHALADVRDPLISALQPVQCRTLFTGHSLGAAMATLLASAYHPHALYTFGSPRVGDTDFVATLKGVDNHRYVDCFDLVTRLPFESMGFAHVGPPHYIDRNRKLTFDPPKAFVRNDRFRASISYFFKSSWRWGNVRTRGLADHAPVNYVTSMMAIVPGGSPLEV